MSAKEFTKDDTMVAKGVAIVLMLIHHLFGFSDRIHLPYHSIGSFRGYEIEFLIAKFGKICVAMFIFLSAYGMYKSYTKNSTGINRIIVNRIQSVYIKYWLVHSFFCYYYWQNIVFLPRYSILITLWLIILSLITSIVLSFIERLIMRCLRGNTTNSITKVSV